MFDKEKCLKWIKEHFPGCIDNHFNYDMMENLIDWAMKNKNFSKNQMINFLMEIVPEIYEEEWQQFYID